MPHSLEPIPTDSQVTVAPATNLSKFAKQILLKVLVGSERSKYTASANLDKFVAGLTGIETVRFIRFLVV